MNIVKKKISELIPADYNPRKDLKPSDPEYQKIKRSIEKFGCVEPLVWNKRSKRIVGGHQRIKVLQELGIKEIEISVVDLPDEEEKALNIALNKIGGEFDEVKLEDLFKELSLTELDLTLTGFDEIEWDKLIGNNDNGGLTDPDAVPEEVEPICKTGDLWQLGRHRLLCGDCTKQESYLMLMENKRAILTLTDPPYNYDYDYGKYEDDKQIEDYIAFTTKWYSMARHYSKRILVTPGLKNLEIYYKHFNPLWMLIWVKKNAMTASKIGNLSIWEPIVLEDNDYDFEPIIFEGRPKKKVKRDVYEFPVKQQKNVADHPCPKLLEFWMQLIRDFTNKDDSVLDMFGGSGTTLMSCQILNRICYMMEIDAHYCDVIVNRWQNFTGEKAELIKPA